jgi:hypothetical protein
MKMPKISIGGIIEKTALGLITGLLIFLLNSMWQLNSKVSASQEKTTEAVADLKSDIYAAFGTIADTESRSTNNEVRSLTNEKIHTLLLQIIAVSVGNRLTTEQIEELLKGGSLTRQLTQEQVIERVEELRVERSVQADESPDQQIMQQSPVDIDRYKEQARRKFKRATKSK